MIVMISDICIQAEAYLRCCDYAHSTQRRWLWRWQISTTYLESHKQRHRTTLKKHTIRFTVSLLYIGLIADW